jgi:protein-tyrosine phosphatase
MESFRIEENYFNYKRYLNFEYSKNQKSLTLIKINMRWTIKPKPSEDKIKHLAQAHVEDFVATLLVQRGIETFEDAKNFFRPSLDHLHDPYLMKDMDKAVARIEAAIENQENIMVLVITMSMEQPQYHWYLLI